MKFNRLQGLGTKAWLGWLASRRGLKQSQQLGSSGSHVEENRSEMQLRGRGTQGGF